MSAAQLQQMEWRLADLERLLSRSTILDATERKELETMARTAPALRLRADRILQQAA